MEKVEIPNTYYRELTEERKETKIKQIVPDKAVRVLLNEKMGIFKMGQLVDIDIDSYRNLLIENKIDPKVSLYSIHFEGYLLKGEYKDLEISPEYLLIPLQRLNINGSLKASMGRSFNIMCVGDFLSTSIEEIKRINLGYGNYFRAVEYDALDEYKNKLELFLQEKSKSNTPSKLSETKDILLRQKEMLEEMSKSFSKTDNNEILHEQSGMAKK